MFTFIRVFIWRWNILKMDLNTLLQRAQNLTKERTNCELPGVERTLQQVLQATEQLHRRVTQTGGKEIQA